MRYIEDARREATTREGRENLARAWTWQRNIGMLVAIEVPTLVDLLIWINQPPGRDALVLLITTTGVIGGWLWWRRCNHTIDLIRHTNF